MDLPLLGIPRSASDEALLPHKLMADPRMPSRPRIIKPSTELEPGMGSAPIRVSHFGFVQRL